MSTYALHTGPGPPWPTYGFGQNIELEEGQGMYRSPTPALVCEQEPSELVRDFARRLRVQADTIESVLQRLRAAEHLGWESPAGRNFRSFLGDSTAALTGTVALLREAAVSLDAYGSALELALNGSQL